MKNIIFIIFHYNKKKNLLLFLIFLGLICYFIEGVGDPILVKLLMDEGIMKQNFKLFLLFSLLNLFSTLFFRWIVLLSFLFNQKVKNDITENLTLSMFKNYNLFPYLEIMKSEQGYFISRIYDEPSTIANMIVDIFVETLLIFIGFLSAFLFCLYLNWKGTILLLLIIPAFYILSGKFGTKIKEISKEEKEAEGRLREIIGSGVSGYVTIKIFNAFYFVYEKLKETLENFINIFYSRYKDSMVYNTLSRIFLNLGQVTTMIFMGYETMRGNLTIGGFFGFIYAFERVIFYGKEIIDKFPKFSTISGYIERLKEFEGKVLREVKVSGDSDTIILKDISFSYDKRKIFENFNLEVKKGEKILIVGENGSGKTTLLKIMCGFLRCEKGEVKLPGLNRISASFTPFVFLPGTVEENISIFGENKRIKDLIEKFELEDKLKKEPKSLSAGERKKLEIIMVLSKRADFYILDEPLANVDENSKDLVIESIFNNTEGKTLIMTLHGEEKYYKKFDRIINLNKVA